MRLTTPPTPPPARATHAHPHYVPCDVHSSRGSSCGECCGHPLPHSRDGDHWDDDGADMFPPFASKPAHEHSCLYDEDGVAHEYCRCECGARRHAEGMYHGTIEFNRRRPWEEKQR